MDLPRPKKTLIEHGICLPSRRWMRKNPPPIDGRKRRILGVVATRVMP